MALPCAATRSRWPSAPGAVGLELTIHDPDLDPDGDCARSLADSLVEAFRMAGRIDWRPKSERTFPS